MIKIVIDPGHGGSDRANVGPTGYVEADGNLKMALYTREAVESRYEDVEVVLTRESDVYLSLTSRGRMGAGADLFHSIHTNAGVTGAKGSEVFRSVDIPQDESFAAELSKTYANLFNTVDRGAKTRESTKYPGEDYYTVIDQAQDNGASHVLLSEALFHSDPTEEAILKDDANLRKIAEATAVVYGQFLPLTRRETDETDQVPTMYQEAWEKAILAGLEDGEGPNETVTSAKLMAYFDKVGFLDYLLTIQGMK